MMNETPCRILFFCVNTFLWCNTSGMNKGAKHKRAFHITEWLTGWEATNENTTKTTPALRANHNYCSRRQWKWGWYPHRVTGLETGGSGIEPTAVCRVDDSRHRNNGRWRSKDVSRRYDDVTTHFSPYFQRCLCPTAHYHTHDWLWRGKLQLRQCFFYAWM